MKTLEELTGKPRGVLLFDSGHDLKGISCAWDHVSGLPWPDPFGRGIMSVKARIPETPAIWHNDLEDFLVGIDFIYKEDVPLPTAGNIYLFQIGQGRVYVVTEGEES